MDTILAWPRFRCTVRRHCVRTIILLLIVYLSSGSGAHAQESARDTASLADAVEAFLGKNQPKIGLLAQFGADATNDGGRTKSHFSIRNLRLYLSGSFEEKFFYVFQGDVNGGYQLLDLKFVYLLNDNIRIAGGQFKAPFGYEYLKNEANLLFVNRSSAVRTIGAFRQLGVQIQVTSFEKRLSATLGLFNGQGTGAGAFDNKISLLVGNLRGIPIKVGQGGSQFQIDVGGSIAYSRDQEDLPGVSFIKNDKFLLGVNARVAYGDFWSEAEYLMSGSNRTKTAEGFYADLAHRFNSHLEIATRFERTNFYPSPGSAGQIADRKYLFGINWYTGKLIKIQFDYERSQINRINSGFLNIQYAVNHEN